MTESEEARNKALVLKAFDKRISGFGQPRSWIPADVVRIENGVLAGPAVASGAAYESGIEISSRNWRSESMLIP